MKRKYAKHDWDNLLPQIKEDLQTMWTEAVAEKHGIKYNTLIEYLSRNNIERPISKPRQKRIPKAKYKTVARMYNAGYREPAIARRFNVTVRQVHDALNQVMRTSNRVINWKMERVAASDVRRTMAETFDHVQDKGAIIINSQNRGDFVLMTADKFNKMEEDQNKLRSIESNESRE